MESENPINDELRIGENRIDFSEILMTGGRRDYIPEGNEAEGISVSVSPQSVVISPIEKSTYQLRAQISPINGDLELNLQLKDKEGKRHPIMPFGRVFVNEAIPFLEAHNTIKRFTATWKEDSDNFKEFLRNSNTLNMNDHDAAFNTWSGRNVASTFGYTAIERIYKDLHADERLVVVTFSKTPVRVP